MAREIERKFLVNRGAWTHDPSRGTQYRQGYLSADPARVVRVRIAGDAAFLTIKSPTVGIERSEFEYPIPVADAAVLLDTLCIRPLIEKVRYRVPFAGRMWDVDEFRGENEGLMVAEVELPSANTIFELPPWAGEDVSADPRYFNSNLARYPYSRWGDAAR
jgi:CYTH domain-containing protein